MLHVRVVSPAETTAAVLEQIEDDPTIANLVVLRDVAHGRNADLLMFDLARENANPVLEKLRAHGLERDGSIAFEEQDTVLSDAAYAAEKAAPGRPEDGVIWDAIEAKAFDDAAISWSFVAFLTLATLIAGTGRYLDQPILIVGAMVVGPEFAPVSAICYALSRRRWRFVPPAFRTLVGGFAIATAFSFLVWGIAYLLGWIDSHQAATGSQTQFIIQPDVWSLVVALLAGIAGVLSLTASKSSTLVGVFISVTTVPAAGATALTLAVGVPDEALHSLAQLGINLVGLISAGTLTLVIQRHIWDRVFRRDHPSSRPNRRSVSS